MRQSKSSVAAEAARKPCAAPDPAPTDPTARPGQPPTLCEIRGPGGALPVMPEDQAVVDLVMLIQGETSGRPLCAVLEEFGRSRSTYYDKLRRFRERGMAGLQSRRPGPRGPWRRSLAVVRFVVSARIARPDRSASSIAEELRRCGHPVSVRSVERTLGEFGLTRFTKLEPVPPPADLE